MPSGRSSPSAEHPRRSEEEVEVREEVMGGGVGEGWREGGGIVGRAGWREGGKACGCGGKEGEGSKALEMEEEARRREDE